LKSEPNFKPGTYLMPFDQPLAMVCYCLAVALLAAPRLAALLLLP
jgi:hypothetical protein